MNQLKEYWLSLDLSSEVSTVAIHRFEHPSALELIVQSRLGDKFSHSENILGVMEQALFQSKSELKDITRYVLTSGPGSFTGLRIAFATIKAFASCFARPIETVDGSEVRAMAWAELNRQPLDNIVVVTQLGTNQFTAASLQSGLVCYEMVTPQNVQLLSPKNTILLDREPANWKAVAGATIEVFPLQASLLTEYVLRAKSRKTFTSAKQRNTLEPSYFGTRYALQSPSPHPYGQASE
ncbi:MAG: tRNA (adenosine(37)-N6)-threonylcarbamoyltransferase complex dimerization subunit type 1 TsaB [Deltaproteobacteria bacterium]|nr:tRNA (adenosine(37)-N6)-threonylcarbamoyltransferase complex dimerization subunit type 1 TsaB [Deltaproteobacteria bacterium]